MSFLKKLFSSKLSSEPGKSSLLWKKLRRRYVVDLLLLHLIITGHLICACLIIWCLLLIKLSAIVQNFVVEFCKKIAQFSFKLSPVFFDI